MKRSLHQTVLVGLCLALAFANSASGTANSVATELDGLIEQVSRYKTGDSMVAIRRLEAFGQEALTNGIVRAELQDKLPRLLLPSATLEARRFGCKQLGQIGNEQALT